MTKIQKAVWRLAAALLLIMLIYVPADQMFNGHILGFEYKFLWQLGADPKNPFKVFTPNYGLLIGQILGVAVVAVFLVRSLRTDIPISKS